MKPNPQLPWRRRTAHKTKESIWSRLWRSRAVWAGVGALVSFVLTQGVDSLRNLRTLPSEARQTYHSLLSWYYDDTKWTGTWSSREEGHLEDYQQSEVPLELSIGSERGMVFGEMFNRRVCDLNPLLPPILVEGEVTGKRVTAVAYAYVHGQKKTLYTFEVYQNSAEPVVTIRPLKDPMGLLPSDGRLVLRLAGQDVITDERATQPPHHDLACPESPSEYMQRLREEGKRPTMEELGIRRREPSVQGK